jgi:hypothetical protein
LEARSRATGPIPQCVLKRKERESNPQGSSLARVRVGCRRQSACPSVIAFRGHNIRSSKDSSTGGRSRTSNRRLNRALPYRWATPVSRHESGRPDLNRRSPAPEAGGFDQALPHPERSAQRESNPHFRHGKAIGCRYIMGTAFRSRIVKETEGNGWDSNPRRRITGAVPSPLDDQCLPSSGTRGARTLTVLVKSQTLCH